MNLADPYFVKGIAEYEAEMVNETTAADNRAKISDTQTFNVSYYDPEGLIMPTEYMTLLPTPRSWALTISQCRHIAHRRSR